MPKIGDRKKAKNGRMMVWKTTGTGTTRRSRWTFLSAKAAKAKKAAKSKKSSRPSSRRTSNKRKRSASRSSSSRGGSTSNRPKRPSISKVAVGAGIVVAGTGLGAAQAQALADALTNTLNDFGFAVTVTPAMIPGIFAGISILAVLAPGIGTKLNAIFAKWGVRA